MGYPILDARVVKRLRLIAEYVENFPLPDNDPHGEGYCDRIAGLVSIFSRYDDGVSFHASNWLNPDLFRYDHPIWPKIMVAVATISYAGLHATAWKSHFPSPVEKIL